MEDNQLMMGNIKLEVEVDIEHSTQSENILIEPKKEIDDTEGTSDDDNKDFIVGTDNSDEGCMNMLFTDQQRAQDSTGNVIYKEHLREADSLGGCSSNIGPPLKKRLKRLKNTNKVRQARPPAMNTTELVAPQRVKAEKHEDEVEKHPNVDVHVKIECVETDAMKASDKETDVFTDDVESSKANDDAEDDTTPVNWNYESGPRAQLKCESKAGLKPSDNLLTELTKSEKVFFCDFCEHKCKRKLNLLVHMRTHTGEKPFPCKFCDSKFAVKHSLVRHMRTHTGEKPYSCSLCPYKCAYPTNLVWHMRTHTDEKPFSCDLCQYRTAYRNKLILHARIHTGEKSYSCSVCGYKFSRSDYLVKHMRIHTGEKPYKCEQCEYKTANKQHLIIHTRTHTGEKPYFCQQCPYKCSRKQYLDTHMRNHTGERPYSCERCDYKSTSKQYLASHIKIHSERKLHTCQHCQYKTAYRDQLRAHIKTHTGDKPYSCITCKYRSARKQNLIAHMKTHAR